MLERDLLREHVTQLQCKAMLAAGEYDRLAGTYISDGKAKDELQRLARDQYRHVELTERLLEILDG